VLRRCCCGRRAAQPPHAAYFGGRGGARRRHALNLGAKGGRTACAPCGAARTGVRAGHKAWALLASPQRPLCKCHSMDIARGLAGCAELLRAIQPVASGGGGTWLLPCSGRRSLLSYGRSAGVVDRLVLQRLRAARRAARTCVAVAGVALLNLSAVSERGEVEVGLRAWRAHASQSANVKQHTLVFARGSAFLQRLSRPSGRRYTWRVPAVFDTTCVQSLRCKRAGWRHAHWCKNPQPRLHQEMASGPLGGD
jgi:hypothetical protein